mgnify:CR=1 FL=1
MKVTRRTDGSWSYFLDDSDSFANHTGNYLKLSLSNIALFTALDLRSTMFSRGRVYLADEKGKEIDKDPILDLFKNPNFAQSQQDFLYSHLWNKSLGNNVSRVIPNRSGLNVNVREIAKVSSIENLIPSLIDYKEVNKVKEFIISETQKKALLDKKLKYTLSGSEHEIPLNQLAFFYDVTNNMTDESYFKSPSRVKALIPSLLNIQEAQSAKNVNLKHSKKWLLTNKGGDTYGKTDLKTEEKKEIEERFLHKDVMATNADVKAESLAPDLRKLMLDDAVASDAMKVFSAYGINKDVINWWMNGQSTHANKEFGIVDWIQNSIQFEADDWGNTWTSFFGYDEQGKKLKIDYNGLPIMQSLELKRIETLKERASIVQTLVKAGAKYEDALKISGLEENM